MNKFPMTAVKAQIEQHVSRYRRGLLSANELAQIFVIELIESRCERQAADSMTLLPVEVSAQVTRLLNQVRAANYQWTPFQIGVPGQQDDARFREGLQLLDESLSEVVNSAEDSSG